MIRSESKRPLASFYFLFNSPLNTNTMKHLIAVLCSISLFLLFGFQQPEVRPAKQMQDTAKAASHFYLTQFSYSAETWARLMRNPEDRRVAARKYIESVGGKLHGFWYAFGAYEGYCIWEAPHNVAMAAVGLAITGGGALSKFETTPLLTVEETLEALRLAQKVGYQPPGK
jgi:uncharacterized protein with GYD domain